MHSLLLSCKAKLHHGRVVAAALLVLAATFVFANSASAIKIKLSDEDAKSYGAAEIDTDDLSETDFWRAGYLVRGEGVRAQLFFELNRFYGKVGLEQSNSTSSNASSSSINNSDSAERACEKMADDENKSNDVKEVEDLKIKLSSLEQEAKKEGVKVYFDDLKKLIPQYEEAIATKDDSKIERAKVKCQKELEEVRDELKRKKEHKLEQYGEVIDELLALSQEADTAQVRLDLTQVKKILKQYAADVNHGSPDEGVSTKAYRSQCVTELDALRGELFRQIVSSITEKADSKNNISFLEQCNGLIAESNKGIRPFKFQELRGRFYILRFSLFDDEYRRKAASARSSGLNEIATKFEKLAGKVNTMKSKLTTVWVMRYDFKEQQLKDANADFDLLLQEQQKVEREWEEERRQHESAQLEQQRKMREQAEEERRQEERARLERERKNRELEEEMRRRKEAWQLEQERQKRERDEEAHRQQVKMQMELDFRKLEREAEARRQREREDREREEEARRQQERNEREREVLKNELSFLMQEATEVSVSIDDTQIKEFIAQYEEAIASKQGPVDQVSIERDRTQCQKELDALRGELFRQIISPAASKANDRKGTYSWDQSSVIAEEFSKLIDHSKNGFTLNEFNTCKRKFYSLQIRVLINECKETFKSALNDGHFEIYRASERFVDTYKTVEWKSDSTEKQMAEANADFTKLLEAWEKAKREAAEKAERKREEERLRREALEEARLKGEAEKKAQREREAQEAEYRKRKAEREAKWEREYHENWLREQEADRKAQEERSQKAKDQFWKDVWAKPSQQGEQAERDRKAREASEQAERDRKAREASEQAERDRKAKEASHQAERDRKAKEQAEREEQARNNPEWQRAREEREREMKRRAEEKDRFAKEQPSNSQPSENAVTKRPVWTKTDPSTWDTLSPYVILDISGLASDTEIKSAYLDLLKVFHPNVIVNNNDSDRNSNITKRITEAYNKLSNRKWTPDNTWNTTGTNHGGANPGGSSHG